MRKEPRSVTDGRAALSRQESENLRRIMLKAARAYALAFQAHTDSLSGGEVATLAFRERELETAAHKWAASHKGDSHGE
jgi:hypothetical protein